MALATVDGSASAPVAGEAGAQSVRGFWTRIVLFILAGELLLLYAPTLIWLFDRWTLSVWHHAHGLLIPPFVAYFVYHELARIRSLPRTSSAWGFAILVPALLLIAVDAGIHTEILSAVSLVIALPGLAFLLLGVQRTRAILLPLSFSAFALPIPLAFTEQIHWQLRLIATAAARVTLPLLGIPAFAEGTTLHLPPGNLEIADACSGFSTVYASIAVAFLTAYSTPHPGRRVLVLLIAVPLAIAANIIRVVSLSAFVVWEGAWILDSVLHPLFGLMTFVIALPVIFWLGGQQSRARYDLIIAPDKPRPPECDSNRLMPSARAPECARSSRLER